MPKNISAPVYGPMPVVTDLELGSVTGPKGDWAESKEQGWSKELNEVLAEKDSLQAASIQVLTKRNEHANHRVQQLEALVDAKDERINKLVDIIINKLGGFDGD